MTSNNALYVQGSGVAEARRVLTNAEMLALNATPLTLVGAPGVGRAIVVVSIEIFFDVTTTGYTLGTGNQKIEYATGVDIINVTQTGLFDQATDQLRTLEPAIGTPNPVANSAVRVNNETAEFTGGNAANRVKYVIRYRIVQLDAREE